MSRKSPRGQIQIVLAAIGVDDNERNLRNKVSRGKFTAGFLLQCLTAIGVETVRL